MARRQQGFRQFELAYRLDGVDREAPLWHRLDRHRHRPVSAHRVPRSAAGDDRDPGGETGARRVVAAQQPEVVLTEPQENVLRQILDLGRLAQDCIRKVEVVEYPELGMEAIWRIEVVDFPAFIVIDDKGNDFFAGLA